jgi:hypothetical protein
MSNYYLVGSSTLFIVPTIYGFYRGHCLLPTVSLLTTAVSIRYWLDTSSITNRNMDLVISKLAGFIYFIYGYQYVQPGFLRFLGYANTGCILTAYQLSCLLYPNPLWIRYHVAFHWFTCIGKMIVIVLQ